MILPSKYITLNESFIGISALILELLSEKKVTLDKLWECFQKKHIDQKKMKTPPTYQKFIYTIEFMFLCGMVDYNKKGEIYNENFKVKN